MISDLPSIISCEHLVMMSSRLWLTVVNYDTVFKVRLQSMGSYLFALASRAVKKMSQLTQNSGAISRCRLFIEGYKIVSLTG